MARPVFSTRFLAAAGLSGSSASVTVPAGHIYVVKQVTFYSDPTLSVVRGFLEDDTSGAALFAAAAQPGTPFWAGFYGAIVFEEGQAFHFHVAAGVGDAADMYAGGYDLTDT